MTCPPLRSVLLAALLVALATVPAEAKEEVWDGVTPTLHEWGTLTSVQGSDGVVLDGLAHDETGLPSFVYDLRDRTRLTAVSPKMETPVIYFYAPTARRVRVDVAFPRGLITQWYPAASAANLDGLAPKGAVDPVGAGVSPALQGGYIRWGERNDLEVLAPGTDAPYPSVDADDPWRHCRTPQANPVRVCNLSAGRAKGLPGVRSHDDEFERCLFYRGLGSFPLPLRAEVERDDIDASGMWQVKAQLTNATPTETVRHAIALRVEAGRAAWVRTSSIGEAAELVGQARMEPLAEVLPGLRRAVLPQLVAAGLYVDEATAMLDTWAESWFGSDGTRLLYLLPTAFIERELPLEVRTRAPREQRDEAWTRRRVFLARLEILGPQREAALVATLADLEAEDPERRAAAEAERARWGRFAEPFLARARQLAGD
ncbi:MAG: hypothetical protein AB7T63_02225 [Planctomycetota bacterium]